MRGFTLPPLAWPDAVNFRSYGRRGIAFLLLCHFAATPQTKVEYQRKINHDVRCAIETERGKWTAAESAVVTVRVTNLSEGSVELAVTPVLYLTSRTSSAERDKYWGPVDLFSGDPLGLDRYSLGAKQEAEAIQPRPIQLKFKKKGDTISLRVDAQNVAWARSISSIWPHEKLFRVVEPGEYDLQLVLEARSGDSESDKVRVVIAPREQQKPKP